MKQSKEIGIINQSIAQSPLSEEFKTVTQVLGFHCFSDLLKHRTVKLSILPGFSQHLVYEYVDFFEKSEMGHLIDP